MIKAKIVLAVIAALAAAAGCNPSHHSWGARPAPVLHCQHIQLGDPGPCT